jgi:very-short-patch-repair endonuclease/predicted transcriptional regulator of viral defense system
MRAQTVTPPSALADLATSQHGVVARGQLRALGFSESAIGRFVAGGRLLRLHRGVYAVGHTALTRDGRWMAAVLAAGPGAVLSHASAAALWELRPTTGRPHVTVPRAGAAPRLHGVTVHRARRAIEATAHHGIPVTTPARTLADLAEVAPRRALEKALEQAEALRILDVSALDALAAARPGRRGPTLAARLAHAHDLTATLTRSELEDAFLRLCARHGLPRPQVNARVEGLEVDFSWPAHRLVVEVDGFRHHGTRAAFERDRARDVALTAGGWRVVRFTDRHVKGEPATVAASLARLLSARRATRSASRRGS